MKKNCASGSTFKIKGKVIKGHQIASGLNSQSPYPSGSIALQRPIFENAGVDLAGIHNATLNIDISPAIFSVSAADHMLENLVWLEGFPAETFSFIRCELVFSGKSYSGWIYYPHPETKPRDFQPPSVLEVLVPFIDEINYGDAVTLRIAKHAIKLTGTP